MLSETLLSSDAGQGQHSRGTLGGTPPRNQPVTRRIPVDSDVRCLEVVGHNVWTGDRSGKISIRKARTGELVTTIHPKGGANVWCIRLVRQRAVSAGHVWVGLSNGGILTYDSVTNQLLDHFQKHTGGIYQIITHNSRVYTCSNDTTIIEFRSSDHKALRQFSGHKSYVRCMVAAGATLITGCDDNDIRIWDISTGQTTVTVQHHDKGVHAMVKVADTIWSAGGNTIVVWNINTTAELARLEEHTATILVLARAGTPHFFLYFPSKKNSNRFQNILRVCRPYCAWMGYVYSNPGLAVYRPYWVGICIVQLCEGCAAFYVVYFD